MIKNLGGRKLSRTGSHRSALLKNLATSLFLHEKIQTTTAKGKELKRFAEKIITDAKKNDLNAKRAVAAKIQDKMVHKKIFEVLVPRYQDRKGGYTSLIHLGNRLGDNAKLSVVKLVS